ncbi:SDR family NAD(P)-dependent oxidoreductase [Thiomicrorhabdus aquaedulcis]|uniref:SDR family NAD(P)-dependent oxidoreductase n=1 Tax=Thiomicrorhabdus aquaedulcis TaxID=2211106 RepID=UPI000FDBD296|nr:SDR family oxidoreductase [Thiomicrorhabdus aquaedulcis]
MKKRVLITGGNKGIGLALTQLFLQKTEFDIVVVARDFSGFKMLSWAQTPRIQCIEYDLTDLDNLPGLVNTVGDIDVLVNNAGLLQPLTYDAYPIANRDYSLKLNIQAPVKLMELFGARMVQRAQINALQSSALRGRMVNNASIAGQIGHPDIWYGIAKAGLINATKSFSKAFAGQVIVNAVAPSPTATDMLDSIPQHRQQAFLKKTISQRFATAQEVAQTLFWLAIDSPEYINGVCIDINNGAFPR